jgi:hypothetical protein
MRKYVIGAVAFLGLSAVAVAATQQAVGPDFAGAPSVPALVFKSDAGISGCNVNDAGSPFACAQTSTLVFPQGGMCQLTDAGVSPALCNFVAPQCSASTAALAEPVSQFGSVGCSTSVNTSTCVVTITCAGFPGDAGNAANYIRIN